MSKIKDRLVKKEDEWKQYNLTEVELTYLNYINGTAQQQMATFLSYVAASRLGYAHGVTLNFDLQFDDPNRVVKIRVAPTDPQEN